MKICAIIYGVVEKFVDIIYWTMVSILVVFELSVLAVMVFVCFVPFACLMLVFAAIWYTFNPLYSCICGFFSKYGKYGGEWA